MKRKLLIVCLVLIFIIMSFTNINAIADFGDFSGGSDYGGSDSSWSSSDSDWGSSSDSDWDRTGILGSSLIIIIASVSIILVHFIIVMYYLTSKGKKKTGKSRSTGTKAAIVPKLQPIAQYYLRDPGFNDSALCERIANLYILMQNCWTAKDIEPLRKYFTDTTYTQFDRQLNNYRQNQRTNYVERIAVLGVELRGWYEQENNDCMVATVRTRIVDYIRDDRTGNIISGSNTAKKYMTYEYILLRSTGYVIGTQGKDTETISCSNCGASLNINHNPICPYCNFAVIASNYDWVIDSIKGISQQTR